MSKRESEWHKDSCKDCELGRHMCRGCGCEVGHGDGWCASCEAKIPGW
jgi:hypothetical protein